MSDIFTKDGVESLPDEYSVCDLEVHPQQIQRGVLRFYHKLTKDDFQYNMRSGRWYISKTDDSLHKYLDDRTKKNWVRL